MGGYILQRGLFGLFTVFIVSIVTYVLLVMMPPGDTATRFAGKNPTPDIIRQINHEYGFNKPFPMNYVRMMKLIVTGKVTSRSTGANVVQAAFAGIPVTASLAILAMIIWLSIGVTFGILGARAPGSTLDRSLMVFALLGISLPAPWLALLMLNFFTSTVHLFPPGSYATIAQGGIFGWLGHLILPATTLAILSAGVYARMTRVSVRQALREEYVKTAIAKGLPGRQVFLHHVLRTGMIPIIVMLGLDFGALLGGAIFTETIFGLPGLGSVLMTGVAALDPTIILPCTIIAACFVILANILVDVAQGIIDPRVRIG